LKDSTAYGPAAWEAMPRLHGFSTFVVDDCRFDCSYFVHCANLFDMHAKYASVASLDILEELIAC
jgi:hypothetical protein